MHKARVQCDPSARPAPLFAATRHISSGHLSGEHSKRPFPPLARRANKPSFEGTPGRGPRRWPEACPGFYSLGCSELKDPDEQPKTEAVMRSVAFSYSV